MRKNDAERRAFLKTFKLRMVEIQDAADARLGGQRVHEDELDAILDRTDVEWRERNGVPQKRRRAHA